MIANIYYCESALADRFSNLIIIESAGGTGVRARLEELLRGLYGTVVVFAMMPLITFPIKALGAFNDTRRAPARPDSI